ncbi:MAG: DUF1501 domain-containing protein [Acidobacteriota bacterium]
MNTNRRRFLTGCSAAIAALAGSRFGQFAFAGEPGDNDEILIVLFLRGGIDGLNLVPPIAGPDRGHYETARPNLQVPTSGPDAAFNLNGLLGLHPSAAGLFDLYQDNKLSVIHAAGMTEANRSHFDAMSFVELGTPGFKNTPTGWLHRHLDTTGNIPEEIIMPALSVGNLTQSSLRGSREALNMSNINDFALGNVGPSQWRSAVRTSLRRIYSESGDTWLHDTGLQTLDSLDIIEQSVQGDYTPANGAVYPNTSLANNLRTVARLVKLNLGLRVATLDLGGWDTHNGQGDGAGGYFGDRVRQLSEALSAFYLDLDGAGAQDYTSRMTLVVQSEFGRRLRENADRGSDHGHGNAILVLSGNATGGVHGVWPGLAPGQLFDGADLAVTTDFRRVLSEILIRRMGNPNLGDVFPGYGDYQPLGVVSGTDLPPIYGPGIHDDDFESGNLSKWSSVVGGA